MKPFGVALWIWAFGAVVAGTGVFAGAKLVRSGSPATAEGSGMSSKPSADPHSTEALKRCASSAATDIYLESMAEYYLLEAERELKAALTPGKAELGGIRFREAKEKFQKAKKDADESFEKLEAEEERLKASGIPSAEFEEVACLIEMEGFRWEAHQKLMVYHRARTSKDSLVLQKEWLDCLKVRPGDVREGNQ